MVRETKNPTTRERIPVALTNMAYEGAALGRHEGKVVFADFGIPGEEAVVEIRRSRKDYSQGKVVEVLAPSPHRVDAPCPYFGVCGGCQWQHMDYEYQLEAKEAVVRHQLTRIGKFSDPPIQPTISAPDPWHYRNHVRFTVNDQGYLGFVSRDNYRFIRIDESMIMHPWINEVLANLQGRCRGLHQVAMRYGVNTGQWLIHPLLRPVIDDAIESGQPCYEEELLGRRFRISGGSFFQVNTAQAEVLAQIVIDGLCLSGDEVVVDAYAGVGTFGVLLADRVKQVVAVEESSSAIQDARVNVSGLDNISLIEGKVENVLPTLNEKPDAAIIDPSRAGCHRRVLDAIIERRIPRVVYVSCDPATLARDLRILGDGGYQLANVQPVDMFPQTFHIESVTTLTLE